jgi:hypothetical protein
MCNRRRSTGIAAAYDWSDKARAALEGRSRFRSKITINDNIAALIDADRITIRPAIAEATGKTNLFDREVLERHLDFAHRFLRVVAPDEPGLFLSVTPRVWVPASGA